MDKSAVIHVNKNVANQVEFGPYLAQGFEALGWKVTVTGDREAHDSDVNVVLGPHYALEQNARAGTLMLDRCFWGNPKEVVSLAWLDDNGKKVWPKTSPGLRPIPKCQPWKLGEDRAVVLNDYAKIQSRGAVEAQFRYVEYRDHPSRGGTYIEKLRYVLDRNDVAVGFASSALIQAAIMGLPIVQLGLEKSAVTEIATRQIGAELKRPNREPWLQNLSYMNWHADEIKTGLALEYLLCHLL